MAYGCDAKGLKICTWGLLGTMTWNAVRKYVPASAGGVSSSTGAFDGGKEDSCQP